MSAFICQPEHFGILAALTVLPDHKGRTALPEWVVPGEPVLTAQRVARELAAQNIRSVAARYPNDKDGDRPGPTGLTDAQILEAAALWAGHYAANGDAAEVSQATRLKLCDCLAYQSYETGDYEQTLAFKQLKQIRGTTLRIVPGYDLAPWNWNDNTAPHLDLLIYGEKVQP